MNVSNLTNFKKKSTIALHCTQSKLKCDLINPFPGHFSTSKNCATGKIKKTSINSAAKLKTITLPSLLIFFLKGDRKVKEQSEA